MLGRSHRLYGVTRRSIFNRMMDWLLSQQTGVRLGVFLAVFATMLAWEALAPRRARAAPRLRRWPGNIGVTVAGTLLVRVVVPLSAVAWAAELQARGIGLIAVGALPSGIGVPLAVILLDLAIWVQHVLFHRVSLLWRLHRMHHADTDLDVTSGARFHPLEILLSMAIKFAVIALLGAPPVAVLIFEILLNACAMFNHANVALPRWLDAALRRVVVTPDMHVVHHSVLPAETDSNFGFCLSWWDRLFATYRAAPGPGVDRMTIGLAQFRHPQEARLDRLLTQPFRQDHTVSAP